MFRQASSSMLKASCRPHRKTFAATATIDSIGVVFEKRDDEKENRSSSPLAQHQTRSYSATPRQEMVLYATIILAAGLGYVGYKKYHGEPLKPAGATEAQEHFQLLEKERLRKNKAHAQKFKEVKKETKPSEQSQ